MTITAKSTKAEILAAYEILKAQQESQTITWPLVASTMNTVKDETSLLIKDIYRLGAFIAQWTARSIDDLTKPVLQSF